jgi:hypothetical protein
MVRRSNAQGNLALVATLTLLSVGFSTQAQAQDDGRAEVAPEAAEKMAKDGAALKDGWHPALRAGFTGSMLQNSNWVGQEDGMTLTLGLVANGALRLVQGDHEWHNSLLLEHAQTKTLVIDPFVKTTDNLQLQSLYVFRIPDYRWVGPFARLRFQTALFPGTAYRAEPTAVTRTDRDGNINTELVDPQAPIELTGALEPMIFSESAGAFLEPYTSKEISINGKLGPAAQHIITGDGYAITDNPDTPALELTQLRTSHTAGAEAEIQLTGDLWENVKWGAFANLYYPLFLSVSTDLEGMELLHTDLGANASLKIQDWLSLDYVLKVRRLPLLVDQWQMQNALLLTAGYTLF